MTEILAAFGVDARLLAVQIVNFALLAAGLWYLLYRPVLSLLDERRTRARDAARAHERALAALREAEEKRAQLLAEARQERQRLLREAEEEARSRAAAIIGRAQEDASRIVAEARRMVQREQEEARASLAQEMARMVTLGVAKVCASQRSTQQG